MADPTNYETGAREPIEKTQPDANEEVSQEVATNNLPPTRLGNSESVDDVNEKTRHSEGQNPKWKVPPSPSTEQVAGAGPAIAERSKDARACIPNQQPGADVLDDPEPDSPNGGRSPTDKPS